MNKIIYAISDVHGQHNLLTVPECDLLISCGDYSFMGREYETRDYHKWLNNQPAKDIISIMGNHELGVEKDFQFHKDLALEHCPRVHFIEEGLIEIDGLKIWCSSYTPTFNDWAYMKSEEGLKERHWDFIPEKLDILATHGPPYGMLDEAFTPPTYAEHCGSRTLWDAVLRVKPKAHIFGHMHYRGGCMQEFNGIKFYNVANCDDRYHIARQPTEVIL